MRHQKGYKKLGRDGAHRKAMIRNLLTSLVEHERIETTHARCKMLKREADKLVTLGKKGTLHHRRQAAEVLFRRDLVAKLFDELAPRFKERCGGYTRIIPRGFRRGDAAPVSIIEFVSEEVKSLVAATSASDESEPSSITESEE